MGNYTKDNVFPSSRKNPQAKADATTEAAWAIIKDEADRATAKTARLKAARLEMEAREGAKDTGKRKTKKVTA